MCISAHANVVINQPNSTGGTALLGSPISQRIWGILSSESIAHRLVWAAGDKGGGQFYYIYFVEFLKSFDANTMAL
jgi:hypothetical protein